MKRSIKALGVLLLGLSILSGCRKDKNKIWYNECKSEIGITSEEYFRIDALDMTIWRTHTDSTSKYRNSPKIDQALYVYILGKLSAIYNEATDHGSDIHDIIFKYQIHRMRSIVTDRIFMKIPNESFKNEVINDPLNTSNQSFNEFTNKYGFNKSTYLFGLSTMKLISEDNYYTPALVKTLNEIPGITDAYWDFYFNTDGNNIIYSWTKDYDEFIFDYGFGSYCFAGCTYHHFWRVRVDQDCNVTLVSEYGDTLPE